MTTAVAYSERQFAPVVRGIAAGSGGGQTEWLHHLQHHRGARTVLLRICR